MKNKRVCFSLLMTALIWTGLMAAPLFAQTEEEAPPATPEAQPATPEALAAAPEASEATPGFLRTDPATVDAEGNRLPPNMAGLTVKKLERRLTAPDCPGNYQDFVYFYPQGFGNVVLDGEIERQVTERFNRDLDERRQGGFCDQSVCGGASCKDWGSSRVFEVHRPSANYVSILYTDFSDTGGAHPSTTYEGATYSLQTGQPMSLLELFPQSQQSVPKYWQMVYKQWCDNVGYKFPLHYQNSEPCGQPDSLSNPNTFTWAGSLADLGRLVFSPHGASLVLGPYESGSNASGTVVMDFTQDEMIAVGAAPSVWGQ